jgi:beta-lactam-binding protein with PASTA domain
LLIALLASVLLAGCTTASPSPPSEVSDSGQASITFEVVPNVKGMSRHDATSVLVEIGLRVNVEVMEDADAATGIITDQSPEPGAEIAEGEEVTIYAASGPTGS